MAEPTWDDFPVVGQAPATMPNPQVPVQQQGPVYGPAPTPEKPPAPPSGYQWTPEGTLTPIRGGPADKPEASDPVSAKDKLIRVIDQIDNVYADSADNAGWGETGLTGSVMRPVPGTAAYNLAAAIQTIEANAAFDALQAMREASPTGGALGQVTERELDLLKSSVANLDPNQSQPDFIRQIGIAKGHYLDMLRRIDPQAAAEIEGRGTPTIDENGVVTYDDRAREALGIGQEPPAPGGGDGGFLGYDSFSQAGRDFAAGAGDIVEGVGDVAGLAINPVGQAWYDALGVDEQYDTGRIMREGFGLPENTNQMQSAINQGAASALTGGGIARGVSALTQPGLARNIAGVIGATPVRDAAAGAGAGAAANAASDYGPGAQAVAALGGGLLGYGSANALARGISSSSPTALAQAAQRQGVDMLPADAGGPVARAVTTGTKASPLSVAPVVKQAQRSQDQMAQAARRTASNEGDIVTTDVAGENIRKAAQRFTKETSERGSRLYTRASELAEGATIVPTNTLKRLDEQIARVSNDPSAPEGVLGELQRFRANIAEGVNVQGLRDARTRLSQGVYDGKMRSGMDQGMWKDILGVLSDDIDAGLRQAGRGEAASMFKRADSFWKERVEHIDEVLQPVLGRDKGGEEIVSAIESMAKGTRGGGARLSRLLANMSEEEAGQVRAVIADRIGRAMPGAQDASGEVFSASTFLTNWNRMTPQAKASLFSDTQLRNNLNDLALLAEGMKGSQSMSNFSNTGVAIGSNVAVGTAAALAHPVLAAIGAGAQYATGRLMASPAFARLLARTSKMPADQATRTIKDQLGVIASRDPALRADIAQFQQHLQQTMMQSPARVAAREEEQN